MTSYLTSVRNKRNDLLSGGTPAASDEAPDTLRGSPRRPCRSVHYVIGLVVILAVDVVVTWIGPYADPPLGYSLDMSQSIDGYWYLAQARAWAEGTESRVESQYRRPLVSVPAFLIYKLFGVGYVSSRMLPSFASITTILLLASLLRRRFGEGSALLGACILALHPAWHAFVRSPVIYPWVSFWFLACLALAAGRGWVRWGGGLTSLVVCALALKSILLLAAPAIALDGWRRFRRTRWGASPWWWVAVAALVLVLAAAGGPWSQPAFWGRIRSYAEGLGSTRGSVWSHFRDFEQHSRLFSALPVIVPLALVGALLFATHLFPTRRGGRALERMLHITVWGGLPLFAVCGYTPLRYLLVYLPLLVYLSVGALNSMRFLTKRRRMPRAALRLALAGGGGSFALVYVLYQSSKGAASSPLPYPLLGLLAAGAILLSGACLFRRPHVLLPVAFVVFLLPTVPRLTSWVSTADYSLVRAGRQLVTLLPEGADLAGPFAHALTVENHLPAHHMTTLAWGKGRLRRIMERLGSSHLIVDHNARGALLDAFAVDDVTLEFLEDFQIRGKTVRLYRLSTSELPRGTFEEGVQALGGGKLELADTCFRSVLGRYPRSAPGWTRLGEVRQRRGDLDGAHACFQEALQIDPGRLRAHLALAELYQGTGYGDEAMLHLDAAIAVAPGDERLRVKRQELRELLEKSRLSRAAPR